MVLMCPVTTAAAVVHGHDVVASIPRGATLVMVSRPHLLHVLLLPQLILERFFFLSSSSSREDSFLPSRIPLSFPLRAIAAPCGSLSAQSTSPYFAESLYVGSLRTQACLVGTKYSTRHPKVVLLSRCHRLASRQTSQI